MRFENEPAFILHARAWRETSMLVEAFTRTHGRVGLVARGVRSAKSHVARASLQPLQPLLLAWLARGELGTLTSAEPTGTRWSFSGDALFAGIYVNELVLRLTRRNDAHAGAFAAYAECLGRLADQEDIAWTLRRFERDLLADLGYALLLTHMADGMPVDAAASYSYVPDEGPTPWRERGPSARIGGGALLALGHDRMPSEHDLAELRRMMREVIRHFAGGELNAWRLSLRRWTTDAAGDRSPGSRGDPTSFV